MIEKVLHAKNREAQGNITNKILHSVMMAVKQAFFLDLVLDGAAMDLFRWAFETINRRIEIWAHSTGKFVLRGP